MVVEVLADQAMAAYCMTGGLEVATRAVELLAELGVPACIVMGGLEVVARAVEPLARLGALACVGDEDGCEDDEVQDVEDQVDWERDAQDGGSSAVPDSTGRGGPGTNQAAGAGLVPGGFWLGAVCAGAEPP